MPILTYSIIARYNDNTKFHNNCNEIIISVATYAAAEQQIYDDKRGKNLRLVDNERSAIKNSYHKKYFIIVGNGFDCIRTPGQRRTFQV